MAIPSKRAPGLGPSISASGSPDTGRSSGTVVIWLGGTVNVGLIAVKSQQETVGEELRSPPGEYSYSCLTTACIGPGLGIAGRVTLVTVPLPPVASGNGMPSVPSLLTQLHMHESAPLNGGAPP